MAGKSASALFVVTTSSFISIVGDEQTIGRLDNALSHAQFEVTEPDVAVMATALLLVFKTCARPEELMLTTDGVPDFQVTDFVMS